MHTPGLTSKYLTKVSDLSLHVAGLHERSKYMETVRQAEHAALLGLLVARVKPSLALIVSNHEGMNVASVRIAPLSNRYQSRRVIIEGSSSDGLHLTCKSSFCEVTTPIAAAYAQVHYTSTYLSLEQVAQHYEIDSLAAELIRILEKRQAQLTTLLEPVEQASYLNGEARA